MHRFHYASNREDRNISILESKIDLKSLNSYDLDYEI